MRAAVIGAGSSGIAALKALLDRDIDAVAFEASDRLGGNWVFGNPNGMSAAYRQLFINTSRDKMEYADYPMPKSLPDFPHHTQIAAYFEDYARHFGLHEHIRFQTSVEHAAREADGTWTLTLGDGSTEQFDALLVANGHHWDPRWPEPAFEGADTFAGTQIHAHDYRDDELFRDRDVVIVGMGNSAMDLAVESSYVARSTYLSARRGVWIVPKYLFGKPVDQFPNDPRVPFAIRQKILERMVRVAVGDLTRFGLPEPDHKLAHAHPTVSGRILDRIQHGTITPKPNLARLDGDEVEFDDGTRVHADVVVYCTGYKITFPFFDEDFISAPDNRIELFQRMIVPGIDNLFFVGLVQPLGAMMPIAEAQGKWIAGLLRGDHALPSEAEMRADIAADQAKMRKRYVASKRHTIQVDMDDYLYALEKERRAGAAR